MRISGKKHEATRNDQGGWEQFRLERNLQDSETSQSTMESPRNLEKSQEDSFVSGAGKQHYRTFIPVAAHSESHR